MWRESSSETLAIRKTNAVLGPMPPPISAMKSDGTKRCEISTSTLWKRRPSVAISTSRAVAIAAANPAITVAAMRKRRSASIEAASPAPESTKQSAALKAIDGKPGISEMTMAICNNQPASALAPSSNIRQPTAIAKAR